MAMTALLSDVHGNLEALEAVLAALEAERPDRIVVLGDTIGYGPNPRECLERVAGLADVILVGNHEAEAIAPSDDLNDDAAESLAWASAQLAGLPAWEAMVERVRRRGAEAEARTVEGELTFVHGSPASPIAQYVWPAHHCQYLVFNDQIDARLQEFLEEFPTVHGFFGHTHAPAVLTAYEHRAIFSPYTGAPFEWHRRHSFVGPTTLYVVVEGATELEGLSGRKLAINPGSVGQPRFAGDPRASYALYDGERVRFRRVAYDIERTAAKVAALPLSQETRESLCERLRAGE